MAATSRRRNSPNKGGEADCAVLTAARIYIRQNSVRPNARRPKFRPQTALSTGTQTVPPGSLTGSLFQPTLRAAQLLLPVPPLLTSKIFPSLVCNKISFVLQEVSKSKLQYWLSLLGLWQKAIKCTSWPKVRVWRFPYAQSKRRLSFSLSRQKKNQQTVSQQCRKL